MAAAVAAISTPVFANDMVSRENSVDLTTSLANMGSVSDYDRSGLIVVAEREPRDSNSVVRNDDPDANREKAVLHQDDHN